MFWLLRPLRLLAKALLADSSPRQLALGLALGMVIGLVPKGNLTAVVLMIVLGASRVNLGIGAFSAFLFSWAGVVMDPLTHEVGLWLLTLPQLQTTWTWLYNAPVVPWTDFNNTIVMGSLVCGLLAFYPVYRISLPLCRRYSELIAARFQRFRLTRVLWGAEWADRMGSA